MWHIRDTQTGRLITWKDGRIKSFETLKEANRVAERWNQKYGAYRYSPLLIPEKLKHVASSAPSLDKF